MQGPWEQRTDNPMSCYPESLLILFNVVGDTYWDLDRSYSCGSFFVTGSSLFSYVRSKPL